MPRKKITKKDKSKHQWFVEPLGDVAHANNAISRFLDNYDDKIMSLMRDSKGRPHRVWQCTYKEAEQLLASHETLQAEFGIWSRPTNSGPIRYVNFIIPLGKKLKATRDMKRTFKFGARRLTATTIIDPPF